MSNKQEPKSPLYAVYGTLRKGFGNYQRILEGTDSEFLGTERAYIPFKMVSLGGFPGLVPSNDTKITLEVFRINNPAIERQLDLLEGYPDFYEKTKIATQWGEANIYYLHSERYKNYPVIPSGDWREHRVKQI